MLTKYLRGYTHFMTQEKKQDQTEPPPAFECQMCGHCCLGEGGIVMTAKDQERLAAHLGLTVEELLERHAQRQDGKVSLKSREDGYCVFFDQGCSVHVAKPDVCRAWPFFKGNLVDELSWGMAQDYCPGINKEAGHAEFVRQGREYLGREGLTRGDGRDEPEALRKT